MQNIEQQIRNSLTHTGEMNAEKPRMLVNPHKSEDSEHC